MKLIGQFIQHIIRFSSQLRDRGQTSVEYILMIAVVAYMIITIMGNIRDQLIAEQTPCPANDTSIGCTISRAVSSFGSPDASFRFFQIRR